MKDAIRTALWALVRARLAEQEGTGADPPPGSLQGAADIPLHPPRDPDHGDFASPLAMSLAKVLGRPPRELANELAAAFNAAAGTWARAEVAGPGFLNFRLTESQVQSALTAILAAGADYGRGCEGAGQRIDLEFVSANPTGPAVVVSARAAAFGSTLANLLDFVGYEVTREYYLNDAGAQVAALGASLRARWREAQGQPLALPANGYHGLYLVAMAAELDGAQAAVWDALPEAESVDRFAREAVGRLTEAVKIEMERFGSPFDIWFSENALRESDRLQEVLDIFAAQDLLYDAEGARWFRSTQFGDEKDRVLIKSNGDPTYFLADAAYHLDKWRRGYDKAILVLGPDHHGHVSHLKAIAQALGAPPDWLEILLLQWVTLVEGGETVSMSKRSGEFVTMAELTAEVGVDVARTYFLTRRRESHLEFDLGLAREQSSKSRIFYAQYATARIAGVLRKAAEAGFDIATGSTAEANRLEEDEELNLVRALQQFPELLVSAAEAREPNRLFNYLFEVATLFHKFYHEHQIVGENASLSRARLLLCRAARQVLVNGLTLMGVAAPEKM